MRLVTRRVPVTESQPEKSKRGLYQIDDHFLRFWFRRASQPGFPVRLARNNQLPFTPERIGSWWERDVEIDVLALKRVEGHALVGECKWSVNPVGIDILDELKRKAKQLNKEGEIPDLHYALFARTGFTSVLEKRAKEEDVLLFTVEDIIQSVLK